MPFLVLRGDAVGDNRADRMDDILAGQVVGLGDFGSASLFGMPLLEHQLVAFLAQLHPRSRMDGIVDALVQGMETTQHLAVGGVDDGVHAQAGNVALP